MKSWKVELEKRRFMIGASSKWLNTLARIRPGDHVVEYLSEGAHGYIAILRAASYVYEDRKVFWPHGLFEYRVDEDPILVIPTELPAVPGATLAKHLEFVKGKRAWGPFLQTKIREISPKDYGTMKTALERAGASAFEFGKPSISSTAQKEERALVPSADALDATSLVGSSSGGYSVLGLDSAEALLMESISRFRARLAGAGRDTVDIEADIEFLVGDLASEEPIGLTAEKLEELEKQKVSILLEWGRLTALAKLIEKSLLLEKLRHPGT